MSRLLAFGYLRLRHLTVLLLILALASTLFLVTALSFLGFYESFTSCLGEDADTIAVYDRQSRTPFTGSIPAYLTQQISQVKGVSACSPETITPCIINNQSVFTRGILPEAFFLLNPARIVYGENLEAPDFTSALVGENAANRLNLQVGDCFVVFSCLADKFLELQVCGVFTSDSCMDDEVLVQLNVGQILRFNDYNHVTVIRAKIDPAIASAEGVYAALVNTAQPSTAKPASNGSSQIFNYQNMLSWAPVAFKVESLSVSGSQTVMKSYLDRYGVTKDALSVMSTIVFMLCSLTIIVAAQTLIRQHHGEIETLRYVGASNRLLKYDFLLKLLPVSLLACSLGSIFAYVLLGWLNGYGLLRVLGHGLTLRFDPLFLVLNFALIWLLVVFAVLRCRFE